MSVVKLILREIAHRKLNFLLGLLGIVAAVALFVSFFTSGRASVRETTRLMRDIGFNLRIIPEQTDLERFWAEGYSDATMPEIYVQDLTAEGGIIYAHLTATLHRRVDWNGREVILTGVAQSVQPPGVRRSPMLTAIEGGTVRLGRQTATASGVAAGDRIELLGRPFTVDRVLPESGSSDDIRIYADLGDVQELLGLPGRINEIQALQCLCFIDGINIHSIDLLREELGRILPGTKVLMLRSIATARERQRLMMEKYFAFIMPVAVLFCAVWIGLLALLNVRERQSEIGLLRAVGYGSAKIASLFLGRALLLGLLGALAGYVLGTGLAVWFGPKIFQVTAGAIKPIMTLLYVSLVAAPVFCALSALPPTMLAVTQDPADTLREE